MRYETFVALRYFRGYRPRTRSLIPNLFRALLRRPKKNAQKARIVSFFTLLCVLSVAVGVWALIVVLSVMGGFENDLRNKILGTYAHVLVERQEGAFDRWIQPLETIRSVTQVKHAGAFISNEVMASSPTNLAGITLKGVVPEAAAEVNGLGKFLVEGELSHLRRPEKIRRSGRLETGPGSPSLDTAARLPKAQAVDITAADEAGEAGTPAEAPDDLMPPIVQPAQAEERVLPGLIIGRELKRNLLVTVGDTVNLVSPLGDLGPTGPIPKARPFRVAGIFFTGMYEYDTRIVYAALPEAQRFLAMGEEISGIELRVAADDVGETGKIAEQIAGTLGSGYKVRDWRQLNSSLFAALELERIAMFVILTFIILVASFNIVATLVLLVIQKGREIAILKSLGASDGSVQRIFMLQGVLIGLFGAIVGVVTGLGTCLFVEHFGVPLDPEVYYISNLPVSLNLLEILLIGVAAVSIAFMATLYPAWQASRLPPVEGLRLA